MARFLLFVGLAAGLFILFRWLSRQPARAYWQLIIVMLAVGLLGLVLAGRAPWLAALLAMLLPFVRGWLSGPGPANSNTGPVGGQTSRVQSKYLRMTLNHDTGEIGGEVLAGQFAGKSLGQLDLDDLLQLMRECQHDDESVALLQAYLDREHVDWQQHAGAQGQQQSTAVPGQMSRDEALQVLGLSTGASEADIVEAHRRLMQKLHPDRGGSAYLAATINLAKQTLLGK
jgi:hypothetical protein